MDEENLNEVPLMEEENDEGVVLSLTNEDGSDLNFEFLDVIEDAGSEYAVLLPLQEIEGVEDGELVILKVEHTDDPDVDNYVGIEDQAILDRVFSMFKDKYKDTYNFEE